MKEEVALNASTQLSDLTISPLSEDAARVRAALVERGLETPLLPEQLSRGEKYVRLKSLMSEVCTTLGLDLSDDSLAKGSLLPRFYSQTPS